MDKNTLLGMVLMGLVLFGFMYCNRPDPNTAEQKTTEQVEAQKQAEQQRKEASDATKLAQLTPAYMESVAKSVRNYGTKTENGSQLKSGALNLTVANDSTARLDGTITVEKATLSVRAIFDHADTTVTDYQRLAAYDLLKSTISERNQYGKLSKFLDGDAKPVVLKNSKMTVTFDPRGGRMSRVVLADYVTELGSPVRPVELLTPETSKYEFEIRTADQKLKTGNLVFKPVVNEDSTSVTMRLDVDADTWMAFTYSLVPDQYIVRMDVTQHNMDRVIPANMTTMGFDWKYDMLRYENGRTFEERNSAIYYKLLDDSPEDLSALESVDETVNGAVQWVAFKNQFFSTVVIPRCKFNRIDMKCDPVSRDSGRAGTFIKDMSFSADFTYSSTADEAFAFDFYIGPNSYPGLGEVSDLLQQGEEELELNKLVPLGWGIFGWINRFLVIPIFNFLGSFIGSYGIIILILTIIIKIILFPFTYKSYMSQAKMRVLAPEIKEINEKYPNKEDAMKRQQETMKLYSRAGASPFSGCLPMLLQLPVLIALFSFFPSAIELRGQSFLWVHDLSAPDYICTLPFSIPFYGDKVSLFCLLMTVTNIISTRIMMQNQPNAGMGGMKWMTYLMPIMFLFFFNDYAAGLSYYYFISLLITITQTFICRHIVDEEKVRAQMLENAKKPRKKKGFMARLEAAQKRQEALMREQAKQRAKHRR